MKCWKEALQLVARGWTHWLLAAALMSGVGAVAVLWLAAPLATGGQVAMPVVFVAWAVALVWYALWLMRRRFAPEGIRLGRALGRREGWGAVAVAATVGVVGPWGMLHWLPGFGPLGAQAVSALVRFVAAWALLSGSVCWLVACLGLLSKQERPQGN